MPYINIHWKGYPHHLPKIQAASTPSVSVRNRSNAAAQQVSGVPLGNALEKERKKQRFNFRIRRRKGRSSRASTAAQARRRASQKARQNIQAFGWDTPNAYLASKATTDVYFGSRQSTPRPPKIRPPTEHLQNDPDSTIPSTDGTANSIVGRAAKRKKSETLYSLMHVPELPTGPQSRNRFSFESDQQSNGSVRRAAGEYAHIGSKQRTYDTRINPITRAGIRTRSTIPQLKSALHDGDSSKSPTKRKKQQSFSSPEFWEAVNSFALSRKDRSDSPSIRSIVQSVFSGTSRTPSQKRALRRFTKEIELYLQAARSLPKQSLVPSITATSISANTILELKPYQSEFQSAGLAVTSEEQRGAVPLLEPANPPPTPPKDEKWEKMAILSRKPKIDPESSKKEEKGKVLQQRPPSFASGSTGTTILGFTPPHEKSYARPRTDRKQPSLNSNHMILSFTPPHEKMVTPLPPLPASSDVKPSTKRSLPWLRRPEQSPEASPIKKMSVASRERDQLRSSTPLQGWVSTFDIKYNQTPNEVKREVQDVHSQPQTSHHSSASRLRESETGARGIARENVEENLTAGPPESSFAMAHTIVGDSIPYHHVTKYVDAAIQADVPDASELKIEVPNAKYDQPVVERAQPTSGRSKTFPVTKDKCKGDCDKAYKSLKADVFPQKFSRPSGVIWQGVDSSTQTEEPNVRSNENIQQFEKLRGKKPSVTTTSPADRNTFSVSPRTSHSWRTVQQTPRTKSFKKTFDVKQTSIVQHKDKRDHQISAPPNRRPPSTPSICSQCAGPNSTDPNVSAPEPIPEPDFTVNAMPKPPPADACTSRSSMICKQCFPSRQVSLEISPLQASSPIEVSYLSSSRRSTRPIVPTGPVTYLEELPLSSEQLSPQIEQCLDSAEGQKKHKRIVQEVIEEFTKKTPIADPMKRPSIPRLKLKATPRPQLAPMMVQPLSTVSHVKAAPLAVPIQQPLLLTAPCPLDHVASSSTSVETKPQMSGQVTDKQVFRGLHVATAAACDDDVDKWIEDITGTGVRKFLADLSVFEGLGFNTLASVTKRAARHRKDQLRAWEDVREQRLAAQSRDMELEQAQCQREDEKNGLKVGEFTIGDQGVFWKGEDEQEQEEEQSDEVTMGDQGVETRRQKRSI